MWAKMRSELEIAIQERDEALARLRRVAQILIEHVGADGPCNAEDAAVRVLEELESATSKISCMQSDIYKLQDDIAELKREKADK